MPDPTITVYAHPAVRRLRLALRILAGLFVLAALLYLIGPLAGPAKGLFQTLPFVSNSIVKASLLCAACLYAAGDPVRYRGLVPIVLWAHVASLVAMLLLILLGDVARVVDPGLGGPQPIGRILWGACVLDGLILLALFLTYRSAATLLTEASVLAESNRLPGFPAPAEQWLRRVLIGLVLLFGIGALGYEAAPLLGLAPELIRELPFVTNSVVKVVTLALLCGYIARDPGTRLGLTGPIITVHFISCLAQVLFLSIAGRQLLEQRYELAGGVTSLGQVLWGAIALDGIIGGVLLALYLAAWRARFKAEFFRPLEFRTLAALVEIMIEGEVEPIPPEDAAHNVDRALARLETERKGTFRLALLVIHFWPLLRLHPPLPELAVPLRAEYLRQRFHREAGRQRWRIVRMLLQIFTRVAHQLSVLGFYSDPRVQQSIGYRPFSQRARDAGLVLPQPSPLALQVEYPWDRSDEVRQVDVCVIGSGAGGATVAYSLAERGRRVLLLERGAYVEPRHFAEDELHQVGSLYQRGMLQISEDFRFNVLQGNCVGGSTTVNNAICFVPPESKIREWNRAGAGLDTGDLHRATDWVAQFLAVRSLGRLRPGAHHPAFRMLDGRGAAFGLSEPQPFDANIRTGDDGCYGCGNCNIGCAYGMKLSALDHTLPLAQHRFPGKVTILAECEAERLRTLSGRPQRAFELIVRGSDGRRFRIQAEQFVVAAGAIGSSALLLRSGISLPRPVGRRLGFNMLTPVFAEFESPQNAYAGIQMGHYVTDAKDQFIIETWFSPPVGLATAMAGWFGDHYRNMRRSAHLVGYGLVVGTSATGRVKLSPLTGDSGFSFRPPPEDMARVGRGLEALAGLLLQAGARRVLLNTWDHGEIVNRADVSRISQLVADPEFITLASSHPQGGNALNHSPRRGVVDSHFRVHGYDNLFVCDASVFPGSVQVNPQMTVMALARYAAGRIAEASR